MLAAKPEDLNLMPGIRCRSKELMPDNCLLSRCHMCTHTYVNTHAHTHIHTIHNLIKETLNEKEKYWNLGLPTILVRTPCITF